jgi:hypothetical protein
MNAALLGEDVPILRNQDDLHIPFSRIQFAERLPLIDFPKFWTNFPNNDIKFIHNKLEF